MKKNSKVLKITFVSPKDKILFKNWFNKSCKFIKNKGGVCRLNLKNG